MEITKKSPRKITIILDRAHGADVAGKRSPDGRHLEWLWSKERVAELKAALEAIGFTVYETVPEDTEPGLSERVSRANAFPGKIKLLISLHNDAAGMGDKWMKASGVSVYTAPGYSKSDVAAECIMRRLMTKFPELKFRMDKSDGDMDFEKKFTVLMGKYFAVLIEFLFQDNILDVALLRNSKYNASYVESIVDAIIDFEKTL